MYFTANLIVFLIENLVKEKKSMFKQEQLTIWCALLQEISEIRLHTEVDTDTQTGKTVALQY